MYHHGEKIAVNVHIQNNSNKAVKKIKVSVRQFADICLFSTAQYKCTVAELESEWVETTVDAHGLEIESESSYVPIILTLRDGFPLGSGTTLNKVYSLTPLLANNKDKWGLALDGQLKHEDTNLASSTLWVSFPVCQVCVHWETFDFTLIIVFRVTDAAQKENLGILVQYKVKIKLFLGGLGGWAILTFLLRLEFKDVTKH